ncbi:hypothetical protein [Chitinimonas lacunae]|uniref:Uncharacterized protein n=1 Tax=Chitinimonas lacunae TaxID=1963018 RepID=A0ABV8MKQ5_9NEIS
MTRAPLSQGCWVDLEATGPVRISAVPDWDIAGQAAAREPWTPEELAALDDGLTQLEVDPKPDLTCPQKTIPDITSGIFSNGEPQ